MPQNHFKLINLWHTQEERRGKYHLAKVCGVNYHWAMAMRDWRLAKLERLFGLIAHQDSTGDNLLYQPYLFKLTAEEHGGDIIRPPWLRQLNSL